MLGVDKTAFLEVRGVIADLTEKWEQEFIAVSKLLDQYMAPSLRKPGIASV